MPTYLYETIPTKESEKPVQFEIFQRMADEPLKNHPETGQAIQRIITAGLTVIKSKSDCCASKCGCK